MRLAAILREAWRNVISGTSRAVLLAAVLGTLTIGLATSDLAAVRQLVTQADEFRAAGASIVTIAAVGRIDGATCDALADFPGVRAAGAVRDEPGGLRVSALPQSPLLSKIVTAGFPELLLGDVALGAGVVLPAVAAQQLGVNPGDDIDTTEGPARVAGIFDYPDDGRRPGYGYAVLLRSNDDVPFDECWADAWPQLDSMPTLLLTTVRPSSGDPDEAQPQLGQLNGTLGAQFNGAERFASRITLWALPLAALAGLALGYVSVRARRIQLASALHSRVSRRALWAMLLVEASAWCVPVLALGAAVAAGFAALGDRAELLPGLALGMRIPVVAVFAALVGVLLGLLATRETHLFQYFKDR